MMTPKELAVEIRVSEKQQSKLRQEKRFPIPHRILEEVFSTLSTSSLTFCSRGKHVKTKNPKSWLPLLLP